MSATRWLTGIAGVLLAIFGAFRLLTEIPGPDLRTLAVWLALALVLHDGVLAPLTAAFGFTLTKAMPARARRYVQGGLLAGAMVTVIALPLIHRQGGRPAEDALLRQNYAANLAILLAVVAASAVVLYVLRVVRDRRTAHRASATKVRPPERQTSSNP